MAQKYDRGSKVWMILSLIIKPLDGNLNYYWKWYWTEYFIEWYWTDFCTIAQYKISRFPVMWSRNDVEIPNQSVDSLIVVPTVWSKISEMINSEKIIAFLWRFSKKRDTSKAIFRMPICDCVWIGGWSYISVLGRFSISLAVYRQKLSDTWS